MLVQCLRQWHNIVSAYRVRREVAKLTGCNYNHQTDPVIIWDTDFCVVMECL